MRFKMTSPASKVGPKKSGTKPTGWDLMGINVMPSIEVQKINCPKYSRGQSSLRNVYVKKLWFLFGHELNMSYYSDKAAINFGQS